ncbi:MAG: hypothetical protein AB2795_17805 [Candidatus Thiodiazotropha endolucinida]
MPKPEIYVSTDIEADGPIPGPHSMLSFASAAYTADKQLVGTFSANLVVSIILCTFSLVVAPVATQAAEKAAS